MHAQRLSGTLRWLLRVPVHLYRWRCGWLFGRRFLLLIHTGRRSGRRRCTVLEVIEYRKDGPEAVVISAFGYNADWLRNLETTTASEVVIGSRRFTAAYRFLDPDEAAAVLAGYEKRNRLIAPIIRKVLSRFLGWRYDGSEDKRRRLVTQLPVVAFRPREPR